MHQRDDFLDRARRHLRLAKLHQGLRDVTDEVTNIREALAAAGGQPATIGTTEEELVEMLRNGHLAEARMLFDFTADSHLSSIEKEFFFSELVAQVVKAVAAATPVRPTIREEPLTAAPVEEAPVDDAAAASLLAEHDLSAKEGFVHWDTARASGEFPGIGADDLEGLNFDAIAASLPPPDSSDASVTSSLEYATDRMLESERPQSADSSLLIRLGHDDDGDDPELYIEVDMAEVIVETLIADREVETPESLRFCMRFFGEKDAIALGLMPAPVVLLDRPKRRGPPPLPKQAAHAAAGDG